MGRKRKEETVIENPTPMAEDAMNLPVEEKVEVENEVNEELVENPVENVEEAVVEEERAEEEALKEPEKNAEQIIAPIFKTVRSNTSLVNVRLEPEGEVLYTIRNGSRVACLEEKDGWTKVVGYIKSELLK